MVAAQSRRIPSSVQIRDALDTGGLLLLLGLSAYSFGLMLLGGIGIFRGDVLLTAAAVLVPLGIWLFSRTWRTTQKADQPAQALAWWALSACMVFAALLLGVAVLFLPPGEFVLGGLDPGVYLNSGAILAHTGSFLTSDPLLPRAGAAAAAMFTAQEHGLHPYLQPGFFWEPDAGRIVTQFPFLLTAWIAVGYLLGGVSGGLSVAPFSYALAVLFFALLAGRLLGMLGGLAAAALLAINGVQLWYGRQSFSEELLQAFLFGGLWAGFLWRQKGVTFAGVAAGLALSLLPLIKIEGVVLSAIAVVALHFVPPRATVPVKVSPFWTSLFAGSVVTACFWATAARFAILDQFASAWVFLLLGALLTLGVVFVPRASLQHLRWPLVWEKGMLYPMPMVTLCLLTIAVAGYTYVESKTTADLSLSAAIWAGLYLSPLDGVLVGLVPFLLLRRRSLGPWSALLTVVTVFSMASVLYLVIFVRYYEGRETIPLFMWATRRFLPTLLPLLALLEAWALLRLVKRLPRGSWQLMALGVGVLLVLATRWPDIAPIAAAREYSGASKAVDALAARTEEDAVLLLDSDDAGIRFAAPLWTFTNRATYILWEPEKNTNGLHDLVSAAQASGRRIYYLSSQAGRVPQGMALYHPELVDHYQVSLPELERTSQARPREQRPFNAGFMLFRLGSVGAPPKLRLPLEIDVGAEDFPGYALLGEGFYSSEAFPSGPTFRWTGEGARLTIPVEFMPRSVIFRAAAGRPSPSDVAWAMLSCGDKELAKVQVTNDFAVYTVNLEAGCLTPGAEEFTISTTTWSPATTGVSPDTRKLGLMLDWIRFEG